MNLELQLAIIYSTSLIRWFSFIVIWCYLLGGNWQSSANYNIMRSLCDNRTSKNLKQLIDTRVYITSPQGRIYKRGVGTNWLKPPPKNVGNLLPRDAFWELYKCVKMPLRPRGAPPRIHLGTLQLPVVLFAEVVNVFVWKIVYRPRQISQFVWFLDEAFICLCIYGQLNSRA